MDGGFSGDFAVRDGECGYILNVPSNESRKAER